MASGAPTYIYKIVPASSPPPDPLPEALPVSDLDQGDGYIHASTSSQLLGTLNRFFRNDSSVYVLRLDYEKVRQVVKWEKPDGTPGGPGESGCFPHLYNGLKLGQNEIESVGHWRRDGSGSTSAEIEWSAVGWPFGDVDVPQV